MAYRNDPGGLSGIRGVAQTRIPQCPLEVTLKDTEATEEEPTPMVAASQPRYRAVTAALPMRRAAENATKSE